MPPSAAGTTCAGIDRQPLRPTLRLPARCCALVEGGGQYAPVSNVGCLQPWAGVVAITMRELCDPSCIKMVISRWSLLAALQLLDVRRQLLTALDLLSGLARVILWWGCGLRQGPPRGSQAQGADNTGQEQESQMG